MISIRIQNLTKRFGQTVALNNLSLEIGPGELFFLLGPSGCGKTTLLRSLAGFTIPDEGRIFFGDDDVTRLEPHKRNSGMMFQSYALWPHMTVAENVAFGLKLRRFDRETTRAKVMQMLDTVQLRALADRYPAELSGGQQQRVALARALVVRPRCLLLDEPLSNLDAKLRLEMRAEIRRVCKEFSLTTVYVTHDQKEALSIADRLAILENGGVLQVGAPSEVYRRPASRTVANFIGETDFIPGRVLGTERGEGIDLVVVETEIGRFHGVAGDAAWRAAAGEAVTLSIRPECWTLGREGRASNTVRGRIGEAVYLGEVAQYAFRSGGIDLKIYELNPRPQGAAEGELFAGVEPRDVVVLAA